jgi:integrase/recombinase XerD
MKVKAIHDTRKMITTGDFKGKFPVKIKVNFVVPGKQGREYVVKRFFVKGDDNKNIYCSKAEFNKVKKSAAVLIAEGKAAELMQKNLSPDEFERVFSSSASLDEIKSVYDALVADMRAQERDGNAISYLQSYSSLQSFRGDHITFQSLNKKWLQDYEVWAKKRGLSINSIGIYLRALRAVINYAIDPLRLISADLNPFGRRRYVIPSAQRQTKKALSNADIKKMLTFTHSRGDLVAAADLWRLEYMMNGCNTADVCYLKFRNIVEDPDGRIIRFDRKKTELTERNKKTIDVYMTLQLWQVFQRRMKPEGKPDDYVFDILNPEQKSVTRKQRIREVGQEANDLLAIVQQELQIASVTKLTLSTARYSAATKLKREGYDLKEIGNTLGHGSEATTSRYTEDEIKAQRKIAEMLVA